MKIIFLDCDGVLNCRRKWGQLRAQVGCLQYYKVDPDAVARLNRICTPGVSVVVSSTWREDFSAAGLREYLLHYGLYPEIPFIDITPHSKSRMRGNDIRAWLAHHPEVTHFVILDDDDSAMDGLLQHWVRTEWETGLLDAHVDLAHDVLAQPHTIESWDAVPF